MSATPLSVAFMPLVDAAPVVIAHEMGFAAEEGLSLNLVKMPSWSSGRDMLAFARVEAAHMLSPVPVAMALGIGGVSSEISALMTTSMNGNVVGVKPDLARRLRDAGHSFGFDDAAEAGRALVKISGEGLRIGVPFPFSMHAELLYYWLSASGLPAPQGIAIRTVPPALMPAAIASGEIDAFCVGEPWGSRAVEEGVASLLLPGRAIWTQAPEKVLAVRSDWAANEPDLTARLMRAIWKACRWLGQGGVATTAAEVLARPNYLDLSPEILDRALSGHLIVSPSGDSRGCPGFISFFEGVATFPWKSQAAWIASQMAARLGLDRAGALDRARASFRTDLYRRYLRDTGALLPGASEKVEGATDSKTEAASESGTLVLQRNRFFDGRSFDLTKVN